MNVFALHVSGKDVRIYINTVMIKLFQVNDLHFAIRVVDFSNGVGVWGTKFEIFLRKNQYTQRKSLNFEN